jgi:hypothetical protein
MQDPQIFACSDINGIEQTVQAGPVYLLIAAQHELQIGE